MTDKRELTFTSGGTRCAAWHLTASSGIFADERGVPCVVMAHGFGGTRDTGLLPYAEGFAAAGFDVLVFDYQGFGSSEGSPRQHVSYRRQRTDYHAAIAAARQIDGVDPDRIVLWGTSYSGGHIVPVAVADQHIAAIVSLTPAMDGLAALGAIVRRHPLTLMPLIGHGLLDAARADFDARRTTSRSSASLDRPPSSALPAHSRATRLSLGRPGGTRCAHARSSRSRSIARGAWHTASKPRSSCNTANMTP